MNVADTSGKDLPVKEGQEVGGDVKLEVEQLDLAAKAYLKEEQFDIKLELPGPSPSNEGLQKETLEEMADDMLHLLQRTAKIESSLNALHTLISKVSDTQERNHREQLIETGKIKTELISERKAAIARATFNAVLPAIESLSLNMKALDSMEDGKIINQMQVVIDMLLGILQSLGFQSFSAGIGDTFDPLSMECFGYTEGEPGKVSAVECCGYRTDGGLAKPCRVLLGASA